MTRNRDLLWQSVAMATLCCATVTQAQSDFTFFDDFNDGDLTSASPGGVWENTNAEILDASSGDVVFAIGECCTGAGITAFDGFVIEPRDDWSMRTRMTHDSGFFTGLGIVSVGSGANHAGFTVESSIAGFQAGNTDGRTRVVVDNSYINEPVFIQLDVFDGLITGSLWREGAPSSLLVTTHPAFDGVPGIPGLAINASQATYHEAWVSTRPIPLPFRHTRSVDFSRVYTVQDADADGLGDVIRSSAEVGEIPAADMSNVARGILKFTLPIVGNDVENATLRVFLDDTQGIPAGPLSLFHSPSNVSLTPITSDYEDATFVDTQLDLLQPTDPVGQYYELDVTDQVRDGLTTDSVHVVAFRLQVDGADSISGERNSYLLASRGATPPQLVISYVPEPSSFVLFAMGLLAIGVARRLQSRKRRNEIAW